MSSILGTLHYLNEKVYDLVYDFDFNFYNIAEYLSQFSKVKTMSNLNYSVPKIYTGGLNIDEWNNYTITEQNNALKKSWYIYYSFRSPETKKLKRQTPIKANANKYKTKSERYAYLSIMRNNLEKLLKNGANPYVANDFSYLDDKFAKQNIEKTTKPIIKDTPEKETKKEIKENVISIKEAFETTLRLKKNVMNETSFGNYKTKIKRFMDFLPDINEPVTSITKKDVINFLNKILESSSARNRNNFRTDLNSFFNELENNELIENNFISKIKILTSKPEKNKTYSDSKQLEIYDYLEENDKQLLLFIKFISYNFLRPVEVCRLKIKDVDIKEAKLYFRAKNKVSKIKIIPDILLKELPDLSHMNPEHYLFTPNGYGMAWETKENNKRDFFTKKFKDVVKSKFELNQDYGLYSFRHTFITKLYRKLRQTLTPNEAKSELMLITGHGTIIALDKYLRDIDAELPKDYSDLF
jgi:integrase